MPIVHKTDIIKINSINEYTLDCSIRNVKRGDHLKMVDTNDICKILNVEEKKVDRKIIGNSFLNMNIQNVLIFN